MRARWIVLSAVVLGVMGPWASMGSVSIAASSTATAPAGQLGVWQVLGAARTLPTLYRPMGLAADAKGDVYVADAGNFRVVEIGPHGQLLAHFGEADLRPGPGAPALPPGAEAMGPRSLAVDTKGTVYVADSNNRAIRVFSPQHHLVGSWPVSVPGARVLQLAVAVGGRGNVLVAIAAQVRCSGPARSTYCTTYSIVQRRSPSGALLGQFHSPIGPSGMAATPPIISQIAVAADSRGNIYVATGGTQACYKDCRSFHFLVKYASGGKELARWGTDELDVSASWPDVAIGGAGNVFLADDYNHRIEKRTSRGSIVALWSPVSIFPTSASCSGTPYADGCRQPSGVAVGRHGSIYVSDPGSNRILKLASNGKLLAQWGTGGAEPGRFWSPTSVTLDPRGRLWVDDAATGRVQVLGADGRFHVQFVVPHAGPAMTLDRAGNVYIAQVFGSGQPLFGQTVSISKFSASGKLLARWSDLHLAELPSSIAIAPNGDIFIFGYVIYLHDPSRLALEGDDILRLAPNGRQLGIFKVHYASTGGGIAVDRQENIYLAYGTTPHFEKRSRDGVLLRSWGVPQPVYPSPSPAGLTLDSAGDLFVADTPQSVIEEFGPRGTLLGRWGFPGSYPGQFHQPSGIALGRAGTIYVADTGNHRIQKLTR